MSEEPWKARTLDDYLAGIRQVREELMTRKGELERLRDDTINELGKVEQELTRIDNILGKSEPSGRNRNVETHVYEQLTELTKGAPVQRESILIDRTRRKYPGMTEKSVQSAILRLEKKGRLKRSGKRGQRTIELVTTVPSEAATEPSISDRIIIALAAAHPKALTKEQLVWEGGDLIAVEAELKRLVAENEITQDGDGYVFKERAGDRPTQGKMLFGDAEQP